MGRRFELVRQSSLYRLVCVADDLFPTCSDNSGLAVECCGRMYL